MKLPILTGLLILALLNITRAQEQPTVKQQADRLFERYEYFKSLPYYLKLVKNDKHPDVKLVERIAECYSNINQYKEAELWYAKAVADVKAAPLSHYYYAEVLLRNQNFDLAKQQYKLYYTKDELALKQKLANCDSAMAWINEPSKYSVNNIAKANSKYSDWGAVYNGKTSILFTSDRKLDSTVVDNRTGNNWFKLYQSNLTTGEVVPFTIDPGNSNDFKDGYHVGPIAFNNRSDTAYITVTTDVALKDLLPDEKITKRSQKLYTRRLQLVLAAKQNGAWVVFDSFAYNNVLEYSVGNAALSADGKVLYFSSDMPGGVGKTDIWYCERLKNKTWGKPVNCGKTINTPEEDSFPYVDSAGVLYYSSKGLPGMGGYDIYTDTGSRNKWTKPHNLKYPINTTSDDFYMVTREGITGYLSSNREGGKGSDDIYSFARKVDAIPPLANLEPIRFATLPGFIIRTIYYDLDKSFIRPDAAIELDRLAEILKANPTFKIELSSYCDARASFKYNLALSKRRAEEAVRYLNSRGISRSRMVANGYSKNHLINKCADGINCTEAEHAINRRTEFKMLIPGKQESINGVNN